VALAVSSTIFSECYLADTTPLIQSVLRNNNPRQPDDTFVIFKSRYFATDVDGLITRHGRVGATKRPRLSRLLAAS
jgi:hypothetical protein